MHVRKYLDEKRESKSRMEKITELRHCPYFVKRRKISKYQFYWRSKRSGSVLRIKNSLRGRIFPTYLGYS